jgi:alkylation response protein AidB-like acyl-CoA dehydrogenase
MRSMPAPARRTAWAISAKELTGPTIIAFGTDAQKERFTPRHRGRATSVWCQGYSEPNAGSDLGNRQHQSAALRTRKWIINGQKIWTSLAHVSDWIFVVCRTEEGIARGRRGCPSFLCR